MGKEFGNYCVYFQNILAIQIVFKKGSDFSTTEWNSLLNSEFQYLSYIGYNSKDVTLHCTSHTQLVKLYSFQIVFIVLSQ